ncbi:MAG: ABC transporter substrate-binding protein [Syntrophomonadaceae bacterium]|nr:ABC transporter substrate-binding protein [Syntrophomonadaceae bacterium]
MVMTRKQAAIALAIAVLGALILWMIYLKTVGAVGAIPFRLGVVGQAASIDPALAESSAEKLMASAIYEPLVRWDDETESIKGALANTWGYGKDSRSIVFMLKTNVSFHNGRRMQAEDIKLSWERSLKNIGTGPRFYLFSTIEGVEDFIKGDAPEITGIKVLNSQTLQINFSTPDSAFIYKITNPAFWVADTRDDVEILMGTGPFKLDSFDSEKKLSAQRFPRYYGLRPSITKLDITCYKDEVRGLAAFQNGELDALDTVPLSELSWLEEDKNIQLVKSPLMGFYACAMNTVSVPFNQPELRQALSYTIDREALVKSVLGGVGQPARTIIPLAMPGYNRTLVGYSFDPDKVVELLLECDYLNRAMPTTLTYTYNSDEGHARMAQALKTQLENMDMVVETMSLPWEEFEKRMVSRQLGFFRMGWEADYPDPDGILYPLFHSSQIGITNLTGYNNPQVDRILDAARSETKSTTERIKLLRRAEQIILDDAPMLWIAGNEGVSLVRSNIKGFKFDGLRLINWQRLNIEPEAS